jgi:hypothetical protein
VTDTNSSNQSKFKPIPKVPLVLGGGLGVLFLLSKVLGRGNGTASKSHRHDSLEHVHEHVHVTHNLNEPDKAVGGWQHLTAGHSHPHNHLALEHSHRPHRNFESEHRSEAHIHDHEHPTG